jgi:pseudouridine synthase
VKGRTAGSERLHKALARAGVASRRAAERLIAEGRVRVNGSVVERPGTCVDLERDAVSVDGRRVAPGGRAPTYLMLHKPRGFVTTLSDPQGRPTVADLVRGATSRLFPVGRLDYHSEGLLLLTDDGGLARDLMHPGSSVPKTYAVKVRGRPDAVSLERLGRGLIVDGRPTAATGVRRLPGTGGNGWVELTVVEGRKHLVRKMLQAIGHPVLKLRRVRYDGLSLGDLPRGRYRPLTTVEIARLRRAAGRE